MDSVYDSSVSDRFQEWLKKKGLSNLTVETKGTEKRGNK